jgi:hypothetical protein
MKDERSDALPDLKRWRQEVEGYLELGMPEMAEEELEALPVGWAEHPMALDGKLAVLMHRQAWPEAVAVGLRGCAAAAGQPSFFIHTAFCLHEMGRTEEAHLLLLSGPAALHREALYHYNMGCYLTVLGRRNEAQDHLDHAFRLDRGLRDFARKDRDLEALWPEI